MSKAHNTGYQQGYADGQADGRKRLMEDMAAAQKLKEFELELGKKLVERLKTMPLKDWPHWAEGAMEFAAMFNHESAARFAAKLPKEKK